ncbi:T-complex protein 11 [Cucumis melo var. makuwa]|uniref:T-complex protein 11 n=2 Tax=Cucumis melo var. makuwa TaxID=1194695 RepID=A0A5A7SKI9_CUCMM|nr:T-complex protein 11 [Cucumis melo var. makuwa]
MAVGLEEEEESERKGGVALFFPANDDDTSSASSSTPPKLPPRLRRRLMESKAAPSTAEEIEAKLHKADLRRQAKRQRAGYLMERRRTYDIVRANMKGMAKQEPSAIIARFWRSFVQTRKTTFALAKAFQELDITAEFVKSMEFEQLASKINATSTIQTVRALLVRIESRFTILKTTSGNKLSIEKVDHLLKRVGLHGRSRNQVSKTSRSETAGSRKAANIASKLSRYPAKVVLFAYMILGHPETVFIGKSEVENALLESASNFVQEFELLIKIILEGPLQTLHEEQSSTPPSFRSQLEIFDKRWCSYLHHFVVWKDKDSIFFEENMKGVAHQLELFMAQTSKLRLEGDNGNKPHDAQVNSELKIMREKLQQLGSLEKPLSVAGSSSSGLDTEYTTGFQQAESSKSVQHTSSSEMLVTENELVANEIVHDYHHFPTVTSNAPTEAETSFKAKLKKTMEKAFWDGIMESMEEDEPDFSWVIKVLKEVRDELCEMSPPSWRSEIAEKIDIEILAQILNSGTLDVDYFKQLLDFSVVTLQKLSAPAKEKEMKASYQKLMEELGEVSFSGENLKRSFALLMVRGLRFVLHQIQDLKEEIANAHLRMVEPLIKGPAGLEYLRSSFSKRCGSPTGAPTSLPLTRQWLSSVWPDVELEWKEYTDSVAAAMSRNAGVQPEILPSTIRTGGSSLIPSKNSSTSGIHGKEQPECKGERLDLLIRLGLLKLVNQITGLSGDTLPETLNLNLARLRMVQSRLQRIIVISTSLLVMRQILLNERLVSNLSEVDNILSACAKRLCILLDNVENAGIEEIVEALGCVLVDRISDPEKLQARKQIIANMLIKSLQEGDVIYTRVSRNIYLAMRGVVLGGSGRKGRQQAEAALVPIGAGALTKKVVEAAEVLVVMAVVSVNVHGDWYRELIKKW